MTNKANLKPKYQITELQVLIPVAELSDSLAITLERKLSETPAKYFMKRREVAPYTIPPGTSRWANESINCKNYYFLVNILCNLFFSQLSYL